MIGLDANILIRYFAQDDPIQSAIANEVIERRLTTEEPGFVSIVTLVEIVWVLARSYRLGRSALADVVERMIRAETLVIQSEAEALSAMATMREGRNDFADALTAALCAKAGCSHILTFDRGALRLPGFELP